MPDPQLILLGDLHGEFDVLAQVDAKYPPGIPVLQVGDFGWYPDGFSTLAQVARTLRRAVYWIRGNHEHYPSMPALDAPGPVAVLPQIFFVPDGTVLALNGLQIGCLGGAASIDYKLRTPGVDWFVEEGISEAQLLRTERWRALDLMVTHAPPQFLTQREFGREAHAWFGVGPDWRDDNMSLVEQVWCSVGRPPLVCGHMHRSVRAPEGIIILDINEDLAWPPPTPEATMTELPREPAL